MEVVKAGFDAWNAGDMDRFRDMYDPNVVLHMVPGWPEPGPYAGREAVMRQFAQLREAWNADVAEPISDFIDVGDRVVVRQIWRGFGRGPDANIEMTIIFTFREGRVTSLEYFWDHAEALKAVGLEEQPLYPAGGSREGMARAADRRCRARERRVSAANGRRDGPGGGR